MSILHVHAKQRDKHTLAVQTEPVFTRSLTRPHDRGCVAALSRTLDIDNNSSSSSTSPATSQHAFLSPPSPRSSISSVSSSSEKATTTLRTLLNLFSAGANSNSYSQLDPSTHLFRNTSRTRLDASPSPQRPMASKTLDDRSSASRDDTETRESAISGLSILSDDTDHFYQRSIEHLRDRQRLRDAANNPRAFGRARPTKLSMDNLDRQKAASDSSIADDEESRPIRSQSIAQQNGPQNWGRKGRKSSDFLRRINSTGDMDERRAHDDIADELLDHVPEQDSPLSSRKRQTRIPGPRVKRSIDDLMDRERELSLERGASPNGSPDARSTQEIEQVKDRGVASSRLADVAKRSLRMPGSLASAFRRAEEPVGQTMDNILGQLNHGTEMTARRPGSSEQNKSTGTVALSQNDATAAEEQPRDKRSDSRDLLRRFARVSTASPSPSPAREVERQPDPLPTPEKTPPEKSNRHSINGAMSFEGPSSSRSSPSISKVPTRSSSLRSLRSPPRLPSKRLSQTSSTTLRTSGEDVPIPSVETDAFVPSDVHRTSLPPVKEPRMPEEHPDPLRSHPVSPDSSQPAMSSGFVNNAVSLAGGRQTEGPQKDATDLTRERETQANTSPNPRSSAFGPLDRLEKEVELDEKVSQRQRGPADDTQQQSALELEKQQVAAKSTAFVGQTRTIDRAKATHAKQTWTTMMMGECPNCRTRVSRRMPTLWDVSVASLKSTWDSVTEALVVQNAGGSVRPSRLSYYLMGILIWLVMEMSMCRTYCPHYCTFWFPSYTDMQIRSPRFPFVLPWKFVLEPTQHLWRGPWEASLATIEPYGWGLTKRSIWKACKIVRIDWVFGPGDERLEGIWDWPWWWTYLFGAAYGADWRCVGCVAAGA